MALEPRCDKASAAAEVSSFQLRSVLCQLKPLEAQLAREEASAGPGGGFFMMENHRKMVV